MILPDNPGTRGKGAQPQRGREQHSAISARHDFATRDPAGAGIPPPGSTQAKFQVRLVFEYLNDGVNKKDGRKTKISEKFDVLNTTARD